MKFWKLFAVVGAVITVGGAVFIFSRPAAAAAAGKKAFRVSADCTTVEIIDEDAAKSAATSAATIAFKGKDERAETFIVRAIGYMIPDCPINDYLKVTGIPGVPFGMTIAQIRAMVGDRTVGEVMELAASGGMQMAVQPGYDGAAPGNELDALSRWLVSDDMRRAAMQISNPPIPFVPANYKRPEGERWYMWGDAIFGIRKTGNQWDVDIFRQSDDFSAVRMENPDEFVGTEKFSGELAESDVLYISKLMTGSVPDYAYILWGAG